MNLQSSGCRLSRGRKLGSGGEGGQHAPPTRPCYPSQNIATQSPARHAGYCWRDGRQVFLRYLRRGAGGEAHVAVESVGAADDVEDDGVELAEIVALEDVGDVFERDGFPDVHANENVAAADALLGGGAAGADIEDGEAAAIAGTQALELVLIHDGHLEADGGPRFVRKGGIFRGFR